MRHRVVPPDMTLAGVIPFREITAPWPRTKAARVMAGLVPATHDFPMH
jgi:hypothetical protein